ncbi:MAG TPA: SdrD B-like domain-containing protein [Tepidisphaeraceae bacterium]|nr:SdrD B-like domain-containing protein [Tepidisphaeraceae bacterium]
MSASVMATDAEGDFVIAAWEFDQGHAIVVVQPFDALGRPQREPSTVASSNQNSISESPSLAMNASGNFAVAWESWGEDGSRRNISARRYAATGEPLGEEFRVNTYSDGDEIDPSIAMDAQGNFIVAYVSRLPEDPTYCVYGQRFDAAGMPVGSEFRISSGGYSAASLPSVAMDDKGSFIVAWEVDAQNQTDVYARRFDAAGVPQGGEFRVNTYTDNGQTAPRVALSATGDFMITWQSYYQDGSESGIYAQCYDAQGNPRGSEIRVNSSTLNAQSNSTLAMDAAGNAIVAWQSEGQVGNPGGIYAQCYDTSGLPVGGEFRVSTSTDGGFWSPTVAIDGQGKILATWKGGDGILAQRYAVSDVAPASLCGRVWEDANGNGLQDPNEGGVPGVSVQLFNGDHAIIATTTTASDGEYRFEQFLPQAAYAQVLLPTGFVFTGPKFGTDPALDSDADPTTGQTALLTPTAGQTITHLDAGLIRLPTIAGTVYWDRNGNAARETDETPLGNWIVFADLNNDGRLQSDEPSTISGEDGSYRLILVTPRTYAIRLIPQDLWTPASAQVVHVDCRQLVAGIDFGANTQVPVTTAGPLNPAQRIDLTSLSTGDATIAAAPHGDYFALWEGSLGKDSGICTQRFNADGLPVGERIFVKIALASHFDLTAAFDAAGNFVIATSKYENASRHIYAQCFTAAGVPQGDEFMVSVATTGYNDNGHPAIAMNSQGGFVITWDSSGGYVGNEYVAREVWARRYDSTGTLLGVPFTVPTHRDGNQESPKASFDAAGNLVITWTSNSDAWDRSCIAARRFDPDGNPLSDEFRVNGNRVAGGDSSQLAVGPAGDFVVTWVSSGPDGSGMDIYAQRVNAAGVPQGAEFRVNTSTLNDQSSPCIAMSADGAFVIAWQSLEPDGRRAVYGQRYNAAGLPQDGEFRVNADPVNYQPYPAVAMSATGDFVVTWLGGASITKSYALAQWYRVGLESGAITGRLWNDSNGNGLQDPGESGHSGQTVKLFSATGDLLGSTTTSSDGTYRLGGIVPDTPVYLQFLWAGVFTWPGDGSNPASDSDVNAAGYTPLLRLSPGQVLSSVDAGLALSASVSGTVYYDANGNGVKDSGENPTFNLGNRGWLVYVDSNQNGAYDAGEPSTQTDDSGFYILSGLPLGPTVISCAGQPAWAMAPSQQVTLQSGERIMGVNFGNVVLVHHRWIDQVGPVSTASTDTTSAKLSPVVAMAPSGESVIVWTSLGQDGSDGGIYAQRCDAAGQPQGGEFRVNTTTLGDQTMPAVAMDAAGNFVIVWQSVVSDGDLDIFAQRYDAAGLPLGGESRVNTTLAGRQESPAIAMNASGNFVVTWSGPDRTGTGVYAQCYDPSGAAQGDELHINGAPNTLVPNSVVAVDVAGAFVVVWDSSETNNAGIFAQRYSAAGTPLDDAFRVNTDTYYPASFPTSPTVAMNAHGSLIVAWQSGSSNICGQRYDATGAKLGGEIAVAIGNRRPRVAIDDSGAAIVAWEGNGRWVDIQRINIAGLSEGHCFLDQAISPTIGVTASGDFMVAWLDASSFVQSNSVQFRRYALTDDPKPALPTTAGDDQITLKAMGEEVWFYLNTPASASPTLKFPRSSLDTFLINGSAGNDTLFIDFTNGNPLPSGGLRIAGGNLHLHTSGATESDRFTLSVGEQAAVELVGPQSLSSLNIGDAATVRLRESGVLRIAALSIAPSATLDLADNDLIVTATPETRQQVLAALSIAIQTARGSDGKWLGKGLSSSAARAMKHTGLAILLNENDILVKYTWDGDVNLDGKVDLADYFLVDAGFIKQTGGYRNGDLDLNGKVDLADYFLIDAAFIGQTGPLLASNPQPMALRDGGTVQSPAREAKSDSVLSQLFSTKPVL